MTARKQALYSWDIRLSVCLTHSGIISKQGNAKGCNLYHRVAQCVLFSGAKNGWRGTINPLQIKVEYKEVDPCEKSRAAHFAS